MARPVKEITFRVFNPDISSRLMLHAASLLQYRKHELPIDPQAVRLADGEVLVAIINEDRAAYVGDLQAPQLAEHLQSDMFWGFMPYSYDAIARSDETFAKRVPKPESKTKEKSKEDESEAA